MVSHVVANWPASCAEPHLLVLGHLDTVHPVGTLQRQPFTVSADRVTGPGCYDMKAGLALMIEAIAVLREAGRKGRRPLRVLITCDEEVGSRTSRSLIEEQARDAYAVLVAEPSLPGGGVKTARKGVATYRLDVYGQSAHAGIEPERGVNAIAELAFQISEVHALGRPALGTTVTVTTVTGGTTTNVVPARASATIDVRFAEPAEGERVDRGLRDLTRRDERARLELLQVETRPPLVRTPAIGELYQRARSLAAKLGFDLAEGATGGGSDGCLTAAMGIPTLDGLGPQGGGAHAVDEHIRRDDVSFRLSFYAALIEQL
jgi:glutamate carboxypeptidase